MKTFWDTSAAINAVISPKVSLRLHDGDAHFARTHLCSEFFSVMTGRGLSFIDASGTVHQVKMGNSDAAAWLRQFSASVNLIDLDAAETISAIESARKKGVAGRRVHDLLHAAAAEKAGADRILTRDRADFSGLSNIPLEWP